MRPIELLQKISRNPLPSWHPTTDELRCLDHLGYIQLVAGRRNRDTNPVRAFHDSFVTRILPEGLAALARQT